jgi:hypothetical protein
MVGLFCDVHSFTRDSIKLLHILSLKTQVRWGFIRTILLPSYKSSIFLPMYYCHLSVHLIYWFLPHGQDLEWRGDKRDRIWGYMICVCVCFQKVHTQLFQTMQQQQPYLCENDCIITDLYIYETLIHSLFFWLRMAIDNYNLHQRIANFSSSSWITQESRVCTTYLLRLLDRTIGWVSIFWFIFSSTVCNTIKANNLSFTNRILGTLEIALVWFTV